MDYAVSTFINSCGILNEKLDTIICFVKLYDVVCFNEPIDVRKTVFAHRGKVQ